MLTDGNSQEVVLVWSDLLVGVAELARPGNTNRIYM